MGWSRRGDGECNPIGSRQRLVTATVENAGLRKPLSVLSFDGGADRADHFSGTGEALPTAERQNTAMCEFDARCWYCSATPIKHPAVAGSIVSDVILTHPLMQHATLTLARTLARQIFRDQPIRLRSGETLNMENHQRIRSAVNPYSNRAGSRLIRLFEARVGLWRLGLARFGVKRRDAALGLCLTHADAGNLVSVETRRHETTGALTRDTRILIHGAADWPRVTPAQRDQSVDPPPSSASISLICRLFSAARALPSVCLQRFRWRGHIASGWRCG